jgi:hypothetical protein
MRAGTAAGASAGIATGVASPAPRISGLGNFSTSSRLGSPANEGLRGALVGHWTRMLFYPTSVTGANASRYFLAASNNATGFRFISTGTNTLFRYDIFVTGGVAVSTPTLTLTSAMLFKWLDVVGIWDGPNDLVRMFANGIDLGTTTNLLDYLLPVGDRFVVGSTTTPSSPASDNVIAAVSGGDGFVPTAAEVLAAHKITRERVIAGLGPFEPIPGKTTGLWQLASTWNPPTVIKDEISNGTDDLAVVTGAPSLLTLSSQPGLWV